MPPLPRYEELAPPPYESADPPPQYSVDIARPDSIESSPRAYPVHSDVGQDNDIDREFQALYAATDSFIYPSTRTPHARSHRPRRHLIRTIPLDIEEGRGTALRERPVKPGLLGRRRTRLILLLIAIMMVVIVASVIHISF